MPNFKIPVTWEVYGELKINAKSLDKAISKVKNEDIYPSIIDNIWGSIEVDYDIAEDINKETKS